MKRIVFAALLLCVPVLVQAQEPLRTAGDRPIDVQHLRLDLKVNLPAKTVDAVARLDFRTNRKLDSFELDAVGFDVSEVRIGDAVTTFRHDGSKLFIRLPGEWDAGRSSSVVVHYRIREPKNGLFFFGPTTSEPDVPLTVWSQGEPVTNRYWIPCLDHPDQKQTSELMVTTLEGFEVLSDGKLVERKQNPDKSVTFHWKQDQPHASYLITLVVGKFDVVREQWNGKEVSYYVPVGRKKDVGRTFGKTRDMLTFFSKRFGVDYPWEKYAQVVVEQFTAGGMENTTATTLVDSAIHDERASYDSDSEGLIAHELGHQWWGDLVTCRDWAHLWLNEGWASYCEVLWDEESRGANEATYNLIRKARGAIGGGKDRPVVDRRYPNPESMFDARAYPKGAWVLHMLRNKLGETVFWQGVKLYAVEHKYKSVETSDFRRVMERVSGRNLERFFYDWTERPGHPVLDIRIEHLNESKLTKLVVKQTQPGEAFYFDLPVRFLMSETSSKGSWVDETFPVTDKEQTLYLRTGSMPTELEIDPALTVLAEFNLHQGRDLWKANLASSSPTVRIRAIAHFGKSKEAADRELLVKALNSELFWGVAEEIAKALGDSGGDICRDALISGLSHKEPRVRRACAHELDKFQRDPIVETALRNLLKKGDPSYFVEAAAIGSFAKQRSKDGVNVLLPWLAKPSHNEVIRSAAIRGLGESQDLACLDALIAWTTRGKPRQARQAALGALARLARTTNPDEATQKKIAAAIGRCLDGEPPPIRRSALNAIREVGAAAKPSLPILETIAIHDESPQVRESAKKAIEQVRAGTPVPVEVAKLREELDKLKRDNNSLKERLDRYEVKERK